ncbi:hypothetical protein Q0Z83_040370 [Actinoplanes sichuanensis]|nr:hypothetical protein Q0Z83_040370 [Actinoplanes sichuanensis]
MTITMAVTVTPIRQSVLRAGAEPEEFGGHEQAWAWLQGDLPILKTMVGKAVARRAIAVRVLIGVHSCLRAPSS